MGIHSIAYMVLFVLEMTATDYIQLTKLGDLFMKYDKFEEAIRCFTEAIVSIYCSNPIVKSHYLIFYKNGRIVVYKLVF